MIGWKPVIDTILTAWFHSKYAKLTIVICYSPIEDSEEEENGAFYDQLQKTVEEAPVHDVLMLLGYLNAKVGTNHEGKRTGDGETRMWYYQWQWKQTCQLLRGQQPVHWRHHLPIQEHPQMDVDITRWTNQISYRYMYCHDKQEMEKDIERFKSFTGSSCWKWPFSYHGKTEAKDEESQESGSTIAAPWCSVTGRSSDKEGIIAESQEQIWGATRSSATRTIWLQHSDDGSRTKDAWVEKEKERGMDISQDLGYEWEEKSYE